jgi:selenide,water dikinase
MYRKGETSGSNKTNRQIVNGHKLEMRLSLDKHEEELLYDPQTSGGLLLSVPDSQVDELLAALNDNGVRAAVKIGAIIDGAAGIAVE